MVDAADAKPACRQAGLPFARMCWFDSSPGHLVYVYCLLMYTVYALKSISRTYIYVGLTDNLTRRFNQHQEGKNKTTKPYRPFRLILSEPFETRIEARSREIYLKSGIGKEFLKTLQ